MLMLCCKMDDGVGDGWCDDVSVMCWDPCDGVMMDVLCCCQDDVGV